MKNWKLKWILFKGRWLYILRNGRWPTHVSRLYCWKWTDTDIQGIWLIWRFTSFSKNYSRIFFLAIESSFIQTLLLRSVVELKIEFALPKFTSFYRIDMCSWSFNENLWVPWLEFSSADPWTSDCVAILMYKIPGMTDSSNHIPGLWCTAV